MSMCGLQKASLKFLVVDPAEDLRNMLKAILAPIISEIFNAESWSEGLALARQERPDIIVATCGLHETGSVLCREIRRDPELDNTPFVIMSTSSKPNKLADYFEKGCDQVISVPCRSMTILSAIVNALKRNHASDPGKVRVLYKSGETEYVVPATLNRLIQDREILCFQRKEGVVLLGRDPVRTRRSINYDGPERRTSAA